jgi:thiosulfate/3-mercaptopyruvate sulfurtransferase
MAARVFGPLVTAGWLAAHQRDGDLRVIDFRWELVAGSRRDLYLQGHIPGAAFVDLDDVTGHDGPGRHPLPAPRALGEAMRRAGVNRDSRVVVYDAMGGFSAARLRWLLRHFGHASAAVLDGGIQAWRGPLESGELVPAAGDFEPSAKPLNDVLDHSAVAGLGAGAVLLDARVAERYRGDVEPIDARPGHIPGARNLPWRANLGDDLRFLPADQLRATYAALGVKPGSKVVAYCGSGVSACVDLLALEVAGLEPGALYEGSWGDWAGRPGLPAARGEDAGGGGVA